MSPPWLTKTFPVSKRAGQDLRLEKLNRLIQDAWNGNSFYTTKWSAAGLFPFTLERIEDLRRLPLTSRAEIEADQRRSPPFGTNLGDLVCHYYKFHRSSGTSGSPIQRADTARSWVWLVRCSTALHRISGATAHDRFFFAFPLGDSLGPCLMVEGALRLGAAACVAGSLEPELSAELIERWRPTIVAGEAQVLIDLAEAIASRGKDPRDLRVAKLVCVRGGGSLHEVRSRLVALWGAGVFDRYGLTEIGSVAAECPAHAGGLHVLARDLIAEAVDPTSGEPVPHGEPGELVLTTLGSRAVPAFRYRTGDTVRLTQAESCPCGRSGAFLLGGVRRRVTRAAGLEHASPAS